MSQGPLTCTSDVACKVIDGQGMFVAPDLEGLLGELADRELLSATDDPPSGHV